jgi:hypothetical protein
MFRIPPLSETVPESVDGAALVVDWNNSARLWAMSWGSKARRTASFVEAVAERGAGVEPRISRISRIFVEAATGRGDATKELTVD